MSKRTETILTVLSLIVGIPSLYYGWIEYVESDKQFKIDMQLLDKENALEDEDWNLYLMYDNGTISKTEYRSALEDLYIKFDSLLQEGHKNKWDDGNDGSFFFSMIDLSMESIEVKLKNLS